MTSERDFDRMARAWLELGPNEAPDRAVSAVLQAVETRSQVRPLSHRLIWRYPTVNRLRIAASVAVAVVIVVVGGVLLTRSNGQPGVGGASPSTSASASSAGGAASSSPSKVVSPVTPSVFKSDRYGYSVAIPALWARTPAVATWDGVGSPANDAPEVDQFTVPPRYSNVWAFAALTNLTLAQYVKHTTEATAAEHPCATGSQKPETDEPISVGGEPTRLLTIHCGILVLITVTIHNGSAVLFAFQDPTGDRNTDAEDRALFLSFLGGIHFAS